MEMLGNPGQLTRPRLSFDELEEEPQADGWRPTLPSTCLRLLTSPRPGDCPAACDGRQRDGSCLCEIVRAADNQGVQWSFEIDRDLYWVYTGPPLDPQLYTPVYNEGGS